MIRREIQQRKNRAERGAVRSSRYLSRDLSEVRDTLMENSEKRQGMRYEYLCI